MAARLVESMCLSTFSVVRDRGGDGLYCELYEGHVGPHVDRSEITGGGSWSDHQSDQRLVE